jgi:hemoglobin
MGAAVFPVSPEGERCEGTSPWRPVRTMGALQLRLLPGARSVRPAKGRTRRPLHLRDKPARATFGDVSGKKGTPTLYEWAGGRAAVKRLIDAFYDRVERDELLAPFFPGGVGREHRDHVIAWWSEVFGGPDRYTRELGGYEHMLAKHRGLDINPEQRLRFATLMSRAADDAELPADPEFRSALVAYLEWGTRLAMHNSQPDAEVAAHAPVPHWGWGEAPPFQP